MGLFDEVIASVDRGRSGLNEGLSHGLPRLVPYIPNIQMGSINLIAGMPGSGKSALATSSFVNAPYEDFLVNKSETYKLKIIIWSIEINKVMLFTKLICRYLFYKYRILVDINYVLSRGENRISQEIYDKVIEAHDYFEAFEDVVTVLGPDNPTGIRNTLLNYLRENGREEYIEAHVARKDAFGNVILVDGEPVTDVRMVHDKFTPTHPNHYVIAMVDHVGILKRERGFNKKQSIDKLTEYMVEMANIHRIIPVLVQQVNRNNENWDRQKAGGTDIQLGDLKESGDTVDAAHNVIALNYPQRFNLHEYRGYNLDRLADRARFLSVLKNRDGNANIQLGAKFLGEIGAFTELPDASHMTEQVYAQLASYQKYIDLNQTINDNITNSTNSANQL